MAAGSSQPSPAPERGLTLVKVSLMCFMLLLLSSHVKNLCCKGTRAAASAPGVPPGLCWWLSPPPVPCQCCSPPSPSSVWPWGQQFQLVCTVPCWEEPGVTQAWALSLFRALCPCCQSLGTAAPSVGQGLSCLTQVTDSWPHQV